MSKTLSTILTIFKIARIVAQVIFIFCIIGAIGCLIGATALPMVDSLLPSELLAEEGISLTDACAACIVGLFVCSGEAVVAFFAKNYFANVLSAGTPFTFTGAKECFRLGVTSIIVSLAVAIASAITVGIFEFFFRNTSAINVDSSISLSTGLFFLFLSLIFKHGAELAAPKESPLE